MVQAQNRAPAQTLTRSHRLQNLPPNLRIPLGKYDVSGQICLRATP